MKRLFSLLISLCITAIASAQIEQSIIVDQATFKAVNSDVLTGVNIDPIGVDSSRRPCARIKMKINRMTREEIDGLQIKIRTNNECIKCKTAEYDNGLIIEMTAKAESRFYLHHDKFGDSNEVSLNLEANKEYYIEASLNQQYSITVASNVADADVYIDTIFYGKTNSDGLLTVEGLLAGEHRLKLVYSGIDYNQDIVISSTKIFFRQDIDIKSTSSQYLIIKTTPSHALVEINGEVVENSQNGASKVLKPGAFTYTVTAQNYHPKSGTGVMRGEQIIIPIELDPAFGHLAIKADSELDGAQVYVNNSQRGTLPLSKNIMLKSGTHSVRIVKSLYKTFEKSVTITDGKTEEIVANLIPNFAQVTLKAADKWVDIWVDNTYRNSGEWSGKLEIGDHIVECRKASHVSTTQTLSITSSASVTHTFEPLKPIYGSLNITSTPIGAKIKIDGVEVGETPLIKNDVLVGTRVVELFMNGYKNTSDVVEVVEGKTIDIKQTLSQKKSTTTSSASTTTTTPKTTTTKQKGNIFQVAVGIGGGWGPSGNSILGVPIDLRIGRCDNLFNLYLTGKYNLKMVKDKDADEELNITQWGLGGNIRANIVRNTSKSYDAVFIDLGAYYNFNTKAEHIDTYDAKLDVTNILNKNSISAFGAIGLGGKLIDLSLYFQYEISPAFGFRNTDGPTNVGMPNETTTIQPYSDSISTNLTDGKFNIGLMMKMYFGSGMFK